MRQFCCLGYSTSLKPVKQKHKPNAPVLLPGMLDQPEACEAEAQTQGASHAAWGLMDAVPVILAQICTYPQLPTIRGIHEPHFGIGARFR